MRLDRDVNQQPFYQRAHKIFCELDALPPSNDPLDFELEIIWFKGTCKLCLKGQNEWPPLMSYISWGQCYQHLLTFLPTFLIYKDFIFLGLTFRGETISLWVNNKMKEDVLGALNWALY
jgi:hypothetical protein